LAEKKTKSKAKKAPAAKAPEAVVDGAGCVMGRLATTVAKRLLNGDRVQVVNAEKIFIIGHPKQIKERYKFKHEVGTERKGPFPSRMPHLIFKRTVRGMLPYQQPRGRDALKRLRCHIGVPAELKDATLETYEGLKKPHAGGMTLAQVSQFLGKHIEVSA
jgi:large subunit ribosomal protein L13